MNDRNPQSPPPSQEGAAPSTSELPPELDQLAAEADGLSATAAPAGGSPGDLPAPDVPTAQLLAGLYEPLAAVLAPNWNLTRAEIKLLADAHAPVLDKYLPGGLGAIGPELTAVLVTLSVLGSRLNKPPRVKPAPPPEPAPAEGEIGAGLPRA